ncbi:MAG: PEGA domain-containing protein [bacterium]
MITPIGLALVAALTVSPATVERARTLYDAGSEAYRQGRYQVAIEAFEEANRLVNRPAVTFSLAQARRLQYFVDGDRKNLEAAVEGYREYVAAVEAGGRRDHAVQHLSTLAPLLARAQAANPEDEAEATARLIISSTVEGAVARVDGGEVAPIPATFEVRPGQRRVVVEAPEHQPEARTILAVGGSAVALDLHPLPIPGRIGVQAPEGARVFLDGEPQGRAPLEGPIEADAGDHTVVVAERGRLPFIQPIALRRGENAQVSAELPLSSQRIAAWSLLGSAVALTAGAGVFTGLALDAEADAQDLEGAADRRDLTAAEARDYRRLEGLRDERVDRAVALGAVGGAALVTGVLLWVFDEPEAPRRPLRLSQPLGVGFSF